MLSAPSRTGVAGRDEDGEQAVGEGEGLQTVADIVREILEVELLSLSKFVPECFIVARDAPSGRVVWVEIRFNILVEDVEEEVPYLYLLIAAGCLRH